MSLALGLGLGTLIAGVAYAAGSLTRGGAVAGAVIGGLTFAGGGLLPAALLIVFFVTSTLLSRVGPGTKTHVGDRYEKGARRDQGQVLANGGVAALLAVGLGVSASPLALVALAGALAAVTADTWGTEIGVLARRRPIRLTDGRHVEPGTSGAVSLEGTLGALAGSALISVIVGWGTGAPAAAGAVLVGGFVGALVDSLLGATVQAMFACPTCGKETERHPTHVCGTQTHRVRGWPWLRNDGVNALASLAGAVVAGLLWLAMGS